MSDADPRRALPSVDVLLATEPAERWAEAYGRDTVRGVFRRALDVVRSDPSVLGDGEPLGVVLALAGEQLEAVVQPSLRPVINGTGVVLHTNLGRSCLAEEAVAAQTAVAGYGNVEFSLSTGERGSRYDHCAGLLRELTGAEAAVVTNNNAAAVSLCVNEFALDREAIVSRGELVEIGGSFRIPDVVSRSGSVLREVGTTNRTRIEDYSDAIGDLTGVILRVHPSNYRVEGFADRPDIEALVGVANAGGVPLVHDIGSGLLAPDLLPAFPHEPSVSESVSAGADLVTFSGDKLLGGPQAGMIVGRSDLVDRLRRNPLLRAFRVDKTTLAALEATLMLYRDHALAVERVPTLRMLRETAQSVEARATTGLEMAVSERVVRDAPDHSRRIAIRRMRAVVGGGSFPGFELESAGWIVEVDDLGADDLANACRATGPPLIGRIHGGKFCVDVRTIPPGQEGEAAGLLIDAIEAIA